MAAEATPPATKKRATFADASPSSHGGQYDAAQLDQSLSEMKAYFADVDAFVLKEEA